MRVRVRVWVRVIQERTSRSIRMSLTILFCLAIALTCARARVRWSRKATPRHATPIDLRSANGVQKCTRPKEGVRWGGVMGWREAGGGERGGRGGGREAEGAVVVVGLEGWVAGAALQSSWSQRAGRCPS